MFEQMSDTEVRSFQTRWMDRANGVLVGVVITLLTVALAGGFR